MIKYEICVEVHPDIFEQYMKWLDGHAGKLLGIEGFLRAEVLTLIQSGPAQWKRIKVDYYLKNYLAYQSYLEHHAVLMRSEVPDDFKGFYSIERNVYEISEIIRK
ncbi:hypothetical protein Lbir_0798 [Legionella birminghamensis]|uniref:DUF4286 family protein n=1 Tax=Legionella birminghamensis TaxID=28083 RepID=A0A378IBQ0_9GAMM|nr:DUF4286 family protein [Legionella birminghamensis]KTC74518.1 hypothetical protein Lbir_0798 [Legionella birminghamensis]STX32647.1 Uncharacterised protein [Legionella birminghamensis]